MNARQYEETRAAIGERVTAPGGGARIVSGTTDTGPASAGLFNSDEVYEGR